MRTGPSNSAGTGTRAPRRRPNKCTAYIIVTPMREQVKSRLGVNLWGAVKTPLLSVARLKNNSTHITNRPAFPTDGLTADWALPLHPFHSFYQYQMVYLFHFLYWPRCRCLELPPAQRCICSLSPFGLGRSLSMNRFSFSHRIPQMCHSSHNISVGRVFV